MGIRHRGMEKDGEEKEMKKLGKGEDQ